VIYTKPYQKRLSVVTAPTTEKTATTLSARNVTSVVVRGSSSPRNRSGAVMASASSPTEPKATNWNVLAHELAHIVNRDVVTVVIGQGIASIVGIAAQFVVLTTGDNDFTDFFLAIIVGNIVQFVVMLFVLAISRYREYVANADAKAAIGGGDPLARALEKISGGNERARESAVDDQVSALCIFGSSDSFLSKVVSTHPSTEERVRRLRE